MANGDDIRETQTKIALELGSLKELMTKIASQNQA